MIHMKKKEGDLQKPVFPVLFLQRHVTLIPNHVKLNPDFCSHVDKLPREFHPLLVIEK